MISLVVFSFALFDALEHYGAYFRLLWFEFRNVDTIQNLIIPWARDPVAENKPIYYLYLPLRIFLLYSIQKNGISFSHECVLE